ncbi:hypothetical protein ACN6AT_05000 [Streptomyces sp. JL4002]|uniref:hypothetical protein n=1 Tax=Streptomyces TaxID=1883 RepID=UPI0005E526D3|nr:hypothetical protein SF23_03655 [Streptomyces sp. MBRL 10]
MKFKQKVAVLAVTGAALLAATPAMAGDMYGKRGGAEAWSRGTNGAVAVKDNKADGDETYAEYHRRRTDGHELRNKSGSGTTVYSGMDTDNYVRALKACQEIDFQPDECSAWSYR